MAKLKWLLEMHQYHILTVFPIHIQSITYTFHHDKALLSNITGARIHTH